MKVAVTYENGQIFQHFGHTETFKLYDVENGQIKNTQVVDTNGQGHGALASFLTNADVDVLICDTAGRLHNKKNLMEELKKMNRIIDREFTDAHRENLIVLDGTTGQNALAQAREFGEVANLTGIS